MALEVFLPFLIALALFLFFAIGWRREHQHLEEIKMTRAKVHSAQRAKLAARYFQNRVEVSLTGVLPDGEALLIGYRKKNGYSGELFPGERVRDSDCVEGTIIAWLTEDSTRTVEVLDRWCLSHAKVMLWVDQTGSVLSIANPEEESEIDVNLIPSGI